MHFVVLNRCILFQISPKWCYLNGPTNNTTVLIDIITCAEYAASHHQILHIHLWPIILPPNQVALEGEGGGGQVALTGRGVLDAFCPSMSVTSDSGALLCFCHFNISIPNWLCSSYDTRNLLLFLVKASNFVFFTTSTQKCWYRSLIYNFSFQFC